MTVLRKADQKVLAFMATNNIALLEENTIVHRIHSAWKMAQVEVNGECIMTGNFWDFHPDCHGMELPDFRGASYLVELFDNACKASGKKSTIIVDKTWTYKD